MTKFLPLAVLASALFGTGVYVIAGFAERSAARTLFQESQDELHRLEKALDGGESLPLEPSRELLSGVYVGPEAFDGFITLELKPTLGYHLYYPSDPVYGCQVSEVGTWDLRGRKVEFIPDRDGSRRTLEIALLGQFLCLVERDERSIGSVYRMELSTFDCCKKERD